MPKKSDIITKLIYSDKRVNLFKQQDHNQQGFIFIGLPKKIQLKLLHLLKDLEIISFLHYLAPDDVTDILQLMSRFRRTKILEKLGKDQREKVNLLLKFNPETAAGLMSLEYIEVKKSQTFQDISKIIKKHEKRTGRFPAVLVIENGFILGEIPGHKLGICRSNEKIKKHIKKVPSISYYEKENAVLKAFKKHPHTKMVVLDDDKSILGVIYSDDILKLIEKQGGETLYDFAGVSEEETIFDTSFQKVKYRYKWLILNLLTAFIAASVVSLFQNTIQSFVLLAVYMPIIAGMGGNSGTQALAVMVRGLAIKGVDAKIGAKVIFNEITAGAINGLIIGVLVGIVSYLLNQDPLFGVIVGVSMVLTLVIAGLFGSLVPFILKKLGKDPATSSAVFITTATDLFGCFIFLGLASILL